LVDGRGVGGGENGNGDDEEVPLQGGRASLTHLPPVAAESRMSIATLTGSTTAFPLGGQRPMAGNSMASNSLIGAMADGAVESEQAGGNVYIYGGYPYQR
ncbi:hypothetical protein HDU96_005507, partial [Phlyctochytrium bullatum]